MMNKLNKVARAWPVFLIFTIMLIRYFGPHGSVAESDAYYEKLIDEGKSQEAREWYHEGDRAGELRTIYEYDNSRTIEIIEDLYARGAVRVMAVDIDSEPNFGETTDVLILTLPDNPVSRRNLFSYGGWSAFFNGLNCESDRGQKYLFLWWD